MHHGVIVTITVIRARYPFPVLREGHRGSCFGPVGRRHWVEPSWAVNPVWFTSGKFFEGIGEIFVGLVLCVASAYRRQVDLPSWGAFGRLRMSEGRWEKKVYPLHLATFSGIFFVQQIAGWGSTTGSPSAISG